ncbi:MAG: hypothetical protein ABJB47_19580 [Actinomycetota bacterium]
MTHKSPYAWPPRPARIPQRAGLIGKLPRRVQVQRAAKLAAIASVWVTGLFVVIAAVAMVAMTTAPSGAHQSVRRAGFSGTGPGHGAGASSHRRAGQHSRSSHTAGNSHPGGSRALGGQKPAVPAMVTSIYSGHGSADTTKFTIGGTGNWKVNWSYSCPGAGGGGKASGGGGGGGTSSGGTSGGGTSGGGFTVSQAGLGRPVSQISAAGQTGIAVRRAGRSGHGVAWAQQDPGTHFLKIRTPCNWQVTVTSRR